MNDLKAQYQKNEKAPLQKVYRLYRDFGYEGNHIVGIFATREAAEKEVSKINATEGWIDNDLQIAEHEVQE